MTENLLSMDSFDDAFPSMNNSMYMIPGILISEELSELFTETDSETVEEGCQYRATGQDSCEQPLAGRIGGFMYRNNGSFSSLEIYGVLQIKGMPCEPNAATWVALLGASRIDGNTKLGEKIAEMISITS
ncbi:hypothetical protein BC332_18304 [Capsicum chinense]|nr:hypothetical protein BC332_18304 [Capsicum chinense]